MNKKESAVVLLLLAVLIAATLFISPANRSSLDRESGSSGITAWEYLPSGYRLSEESSMGLDSIGGDAVWTSLYGLDKDKTVDAEVFWLRGILPENLSICSPALFLEFDFPVEIYVEGELIYSYGALTDRDRVLPFQHLVPVSEMHKGKPIYFKYPAREGLRVKDLRHLTAWDIAEVSDKIRELSNHEILPMLLSVIGAFTGACLILIAGLIYGKQRDEAQLTAYGGLFVLLISVSVLNYLYIVRGFLNKPVVAFYTDYISYILIAYAAGSFLAKLLKSKVKVRLSMLNKVFPPFLAFVILLSRIPGFDISRIDYVFNICLLGYSVYMMYLMIGELGEGQKDLRIITAGLVAVGASGVADVLKQLKLLNYPGLVSCYGIFILTVCMVCYFGLRFFHLYNDVKAANMQLTASKEIIEEINRNLDKKVNEKTSAIRSLFDNAEQGFLSFGEDLKIRGEYSLKCRDIFSGEINGRSLPSLISGGNPEQEEFIRTILLKVFELQDGKKQEIYLSLLPAELTVNGKLINIAYKLMDGHTEESEPSCMAILTDITEKRQLETKLAREQSDLRMGIKVVANHNDFVNAVCDYKSFCSSGAGEIIGSGADAGSIYAELFREIHTFKGTFAQFDMRNTAQKLHNFETAVDDLRKAGGGLKELEELLEANKLEEWPEEDFDILRRVLGERYLKFDKLVVIEESRVKDIENRILASFSGDKCHDLVKDIRRLRYRPLKEMLRHYPEYCIRLGERLDKPISSFEIQGSDPAVDPEVYSGLCRAMVHIFRNMVDHGIESMEERIRNGKTETGNISCSIKASGNNIEITVCDDGAGIDVQNIRRIAAERGFMTPEEAASASEAEILRIIFADGFTTCENTTGLSGRGTGLSALKAEVELLSGSIRVKTKKGQGTSFHITVPVID